MHRKLILIVFKNYSRYKDQYGKMNYIKRVGKISEKFKIFYNLATNILGFKKQQTRNDGGQ